MKLQMQNNFMIIFFVPEIALSVLSMLALMYGLFIKKDSFISGVNYFIGNLFKNMSSSFNAMRYHSLISDKESLPEKIKITAELENGLIMGIEHESYPVYGVQFHPESIATENGTQIIENFLEIRL